MRLKILSFILILVFLGLYSLTLFNCTLTGNDDEEDSYSYNPYGPWVSLGYPGLGSVGRNSIAIGTSDNKPVVAVDGHVLKWSSGTTWTDLGCPGAGSIVIGPLDNKPVVVSGAHVQKWSSGTGWVDLGFVSSGDANYTSIAIDPSDNKPVVAFSCDNIVFVKKWSSDTTWTDLGCPSIGTALHPSIAIDPSDNKPIVAYSGYSNTVYVKKWSSGTTWTDLGSLYGYYYSEYIQDISIVIDPLDKKPVVAFSDHYHAYVKKWLSDSTWTNLGCPGGGMYIRGITLSIDPSNGNPVIAFSNQNYSEIWIEVWKLKGTEWIDLDFFYSFYFDESVSMAIDPSDNKPVIMISEIIEWVQYGDYMAIPIMKVHVLKYNP